MAEGFFPASMNGEGLKPITDDTRSTDGLAVCALEYVGDKDGNFLEANELPPGAVKRGYTREVSENARNQLCFYQKATIFAGYNCAIHKVRDKSDSWHAEGSLLPEQFVWEAIFALPAEDVEQLDHAARSKGIVVERATPVESVMASLFHSYSSPTPCGHGFCKKTE